MNPSMDNTNTNTTPSDQQKATIHRYSCCFCLPVTHSTWWRSDDKWWGRGVGALMKFREWSELVAGPRWKTFIRRFNRSRSGTGRLNLNGPFNYDPLSYSLNFDEGSDQSGGLSRDFTARYAAVPKPGS